MTGSIARPAPMIVATARPQLRSYMSAPARSSGGPSTGPPARCARWPSSPSPYPGTAARATLPARTPATPHPSRSSVHALSHPSAHARHLPRTRGGRPFLRIPGLAPRAHRPRARGHPHRPGGGAHGADRHSAAHGCAQRPRRSGHPDRPVRPQRDRGGGCPGRNAVLHRFRRGRGPHAHPGESSRWGLHPGGGPARRLVKPGCERSGGHHLLAAVPRDGR